MKLKPLNNLQPLLSSHIGFENLFNEIESFFEKGYEPASFPPYNIIKDGTNYKIELALAGFKKNEIKVYHDKKNGKLVISGEKLQEKQEEIFYVAKKIAQRSFSTSFKVADNIEIGDAHMEDGILVISLLVVEKEENKPLFINIK
jgi:molecular chaperone IbpA